MARRPDLEVFCREHDLPLLTIAELVAHRKATELLVEEVAAARLPSDHADQTFTVRAFRNRMDGVEHLALVTGPLSGAPLVRDHGAGVVPGVDGRIYQFDDDLEPRALPATAQELAAMDVPMMACENLPDTLVPASEGPAWRNCGILTSHREKSIWAVDVDTGELQWVHPDDGKNSERNKGKGTPAFLQREEYTVAAMDAQTGTESWSVSVAHLSAFGLTSADVSERVGVVAVAGLLKKEKKDCMEEGSVGWECEQRSPPKFPSLEVASTTTGYAVTAFDEDKIVWTTDLPALPTEFFGASKNGAWSSLVVTAPRQQSQALVAGSMDLLAHAVGRPLSSDMGENARLAARVARAALPSGFYCREAVCSPHP